MIHVNSFGVILLLSMMVTAVELLRRNCASSGAGCLVTGFSVNNEYVNLDNASVNGSAVNSYCEICRAPTTQWLINAFTLLQL